MHEMNFFLSSTSSSSWLELEIKLDCLSLVAIAPVLLYSILLSTRGNSLSILLDTVEVLVQVLLLYDCHEKMEKSKIHPPLIDMGPGDFFHHICERKKKVDRPFLL